MVQTKFATILLVAAAATIAPVLAAPAVEGTTLDLAAREPEVYERALAFDDAPLQIREVDDPMNFVERSIDDALDLEQREVEGFELEEREFDDELELEERSFEDEQLEERELADAVELDAREPFFFGRLKNLFRKKKAKKTESEDVPTL